MEHERQARIDAVDAGYTARGHRSFEFASLEVPAGTLCALLSEDAEPARDLALAIGGHLVPTSGSLAIDGVDITGGGRLSRGVCGIGIFSEFYPVDLKLTVDELVSREMRLRLGAHGAPDVLEYLACFGVATRAEQRADDIDAASRARLSGALACAGEVRVAALDISDACLRGLSAADACEVMAAIASFSHKSGCTVAVATSDPVVAAAADMACPLDIPSAEALEGLRAHR